MGCCQAQRVASMLIVINSFIGYAHKYCDDYLSFFNSSWLGIKS
jgi:hypothetical protein